MDLKDAKLGDQYRVFLDAENKLSNEPGVKTVLATVVGISKPGRIEYLILGWKEGQERPTNALSRLSGNEENDYISDHFYYIHGRSVTRKQIVAVQIVHGLDGFPCSKCTNFYPYAVPNRPDGTLLCWSCRDGKKVF